MILVSNVVKLFQLIRIIWPRFSLFQKWSNYYNLLELSDWDLNIPTYWNYLTEIQLISEVVKLFQLIGITWPRFNLFQKWSNYSNLLKLSDRVWIFKVTYNLKRWYFISFSIHIVLNQQLIKNSKNSIAVIFFLFIFSIKFKSSIIHVFYAQQQSYRSVLFFR